MAKRTDGIPRIELPSWGKKLQMPRPEYRRYDTRRARRNRLLMLTAEPLCRRCGAAAVEVHHAVPLSAGGHPWDFGNLEPLCEDCHARIHGRRRGKPLEPRPPAAGPEWCPIY